VWWPDYAGNNMFNSFGNLTIDPTAALLFVDFDSGRTLQLSGTASIEWDHFGEPGDDGRIPADEPASTPNASSRGT
jgi:uncharacterized protein